MLFENSADKNQFTENYGGRTMNKRMIGITVFLCVFLLALSAVVALANDQSALVVDQAKIFGEKLSQVEQAAKELQRNGADVHVWTIDTFSGESSTLDGYFEKLLKKSPAWQSPSGGRKNNLIVLMISTKERKVGIYYGGEWNQPLKQNWLRIQTDLMNPKFRRGDFADGFVAGLNEISSVIHNYLHPTSGKSQVVVVPSQPSQPTDFSGLWTAIKWAILLGFLCFAVFWLFRLWTTRHEELERKSRAQQKAKIEKTGVSKKIASIRASLAEIEPMYSALCGTLHENEVEKLKKKASDLGADCVALSEAFTATNSSVGDPDDPTFSEAQYQAIEEKYQELTGQADKAIGKVKSFQKEVSYLRDLMTTAPKEMEQLKQGIAEAAKLLDTVAAKGINVDAQRSMINEAMKLLENLNNLIAERRYGEIPAVAETVRAKYQEAEEGALALVDRQERTEKAKAGIQEDVSGAEAKIQEAKEVLKKDDSLVPEEARQILNEAGQKLAFAKKELKQTAPDYLKASEACQEAQNLAERAMVLERKRQAEVIIADLRQQMRDNPRNISPEARRQMEQIEADYRRAESGGLSNTDLLLLYMMLNQHSHDTIVINQGHIDSGARFPDYSYRESEESREHSGGSRSHNEESGGGSSGWGGGDDGGGGGSSDWGGGDSGDGDSGGGGSSDY